MRESMPLNIEVEFKLMETQPGLLDRVSDILIQRGDEFEWISDAGDLSQKTGIAYIQYDTMLPTSFLFMESNNPQTLVLDVLFATKVPQDKQVEVNLILNKLNEERVSGDFRLDLDSGYVYFHQSAIVENMNLTDRQFNQMVMNLERVGLDMAEMYAQTLESEFPES